MQLDDINTMLIARNARYGHFDATADISQSLKSIMHDYKGWIILTNYQREALDMIQLKIARILNGDPNYIDSWIDIAGYAKLVANKIDGHYTDVSS